MRQIADLEVDGRVVLLRADFNVPLDIGSDDSAVGPAITDDRRIKASLPTITKLAGRGARVLVCAHLGRPKGDDFAARVAGGPSLRPVADRLGELLSRPVALARDVVGPSAVQIARQLADGE